MPARAFRHSPHAAVAGTRIASIRNPLDSAQLGDLAILASTTTGEVVDPFRMPAVARAARITLLRSRSARTNV